MHTDFAVVGKSLDRFSYLSGPESNNITFSILFSQGKFDAL